MSSAFPPCWMCCWPAGAMAGMGTNCSGTNCSGTNCSGTNCSGTNCSGTNSSSEPSLGTELPNSWLAVTSSTVLALGLLGNALSLPLLSCRTKALSHSSLLLLQLALLDTLLLAVLPLHVHSQLRGDSWSFGDTACRVTGTLFQLHSWLSVALLGCLALHLYLASLHPFTSIQLRTSHYCLVAAGLWLVALAGTVPLVPLSTGVREGTACLGNLPAHPTAPQAVLVLIWGFLGPFSLVFVGFPLAAWRISRAGRRAGRRKTLRTIIILTGICALCFLPHSLGQLLQLLLGTGLIPQEPFLNLVPKIQRVTSGLGSLSCCLNPVLYQFWASRRRWHCPFRLRVKSQKVFTICDHNFGDPSWGCQLGQKRAKKPNFGVGID